MGGKALTAARAELERRDDIRERIDASTRGRRVEDIAEQTHDLGSLAFANSEGVHEGPGEISPALRREVRSSEVGIITHDTDLHEAISFLQLLGQHDEIDFSAGPVLVLAVFTQQVLSRVTGQYCRAFSRDGIIEASHFTLRPGARLPDRETTWAREGSLSVLIRGEP